MGHAIPEQNPSVVLRSHFKIVRAMLGVAIIAVVGLAIALVVVANDTDDVTGTTSAKPVGSINYGGFNPATGRPDSAPLPQQEAQAPPATTRYDGGPDEGSRGPLTSRAGAGHPLRRRPGGGHQGSGLQHGLASAAGNREGPPSRGALRT